MSNGKGKDKGNGKERGNGPGKGNGKAKGRPPWAGDPDAKEKGDWKDLANIGQGQLGMKVTDSDGNVKEHKRYVRVEGLGSVEAAEAAQSDAISALNNPDTSWVYKRRDKIRDKNK